MNTLQVYAMQMDPLYYPEPHQFKPERFLGENSAEKGAINRPYFPFGDGPRNCIGKFGFFDWLSAFELRSKIFNKH